MTSLSRRAALGLTAACVLLLAACDDSNPAAPLPITPDPAQVVTLQPTIYLIKPSTMPGYGRTAMSLSPASIASSVGDPSLQSLLESEGYVIGASATYQPPKPTASVPFQQVIDTASLFRDAAGATRYFGEEAARQHKTPSSGGSLSDLTGLPTGGADEVVGYAATESPAQPTGYLVLARRGRVVVELFASGDPATATRDQLLPLLTAQEVLLQTNPDQPA